MYVLVNGFLDPLNKKGPDFERNKDRILDKINSVDATFLTTSPSALSFIPKEKCFYILIHQTSLSKH